LKLSARCLSVEAGMRMRTASIFNVYRVAVASKFKTQYHNSWSMRRKAALLNILWRFDYDKNKRLRPASGAGHGAVCSQAWRRGTPPTRRRCWARSNISTDGTKCPIFYLRKGASLSTPILIKQAQTARIGIRLIASPLPPRALTRAWQTASAQISCRPESVRPEDNGIVANGYPTRGLES
jgi:hypothetical protein